MTCTFFSCFFPEPLTSQTSSLPGMMVGLHSSPGAAVPPHMLPAFLAVPWEFHSFPGIVLGAVYF